MRKFFLVVFALLLAFQVFSQPETKKENTKEYYLAKSKSRKKTANILLIGGATSTIIGFIIPRGDKKPNQSISSIFWGPEYENDDIKSAFGSIGFLSMLTSVPFYLSSSRKKKLARKATTLNFNNLKIPVPEQSGFVFRRQPTLTLKIDL